MTAHIVSFGVSVWRDGDGTLFTNADLADPALALPALTLTLTCDAALDEVPAGTEIGLADAKVSSASEVSCQRHAGDTADAPGAVLQQW